MVTAAATRLARHRLPTWQDRADRNIKHCKECDDLVYWPSRTRPLCQRCGIDYPFPDDNGDAQ